jgi:hypothetical protein
MLIPGTLMKKALKGDLPLLRKARALQEELLQPMPLPSFDDTLSLETYRLAQAKRTFLAIGGAAVQKLGLRLEQEQEVLVALADIMIGIYAMESALLRVRKLIASSGEARAENAVQMTTVFVQDTMERIETLAKKTLAALEQGDALQVQLSVLKKLMRAPLVDTIAIKRSIAAKVKEAGRYVV